MRSSRLHWLLSLLLIGITLAAGWLTQRFNIATDITVNARHSISLSSEKVLRALEAPVEIVAVIGPDAQQRSAVSTLVDRMKTIKPDISLSFINPETQPAAARELNAAPGGELILRTAGREQRLQNLSERSVSDSLRQLSREGDRDIVFITGHDERSPIAVTNDDWSTVASRLSRIGLVSRELSLVSNPYLSEDIDLVIIAAPRRPYFPGELASLNNYLSQGGNLLWLTEASGNTSTGPNLQLIADTMGVDILPGVVIDTASQVLDAETPDFVLLDRFPEHPVTRLLTQPVLLPQASALAVTPMAGQSVSPLLQTPQSSWTESGELTGAIAFDENTTEVSGPLLLGVTVERQLAETTQRMAMLGDADFGASQFIDNGDNQRFIESLMLWLTGDTEDMNFVTQAAPDSTLVLDNRSIVILSAVLLAGLPLTLLLTGLCIRWQRRKF